MPPKSTPSPPANKLYPWAEWLDHPHVVTLRQGRDYRCGHATFVQQVRNEATRRRVLVSVAEVPGGVRLTVKGPRPSTLYAGIDPGRNGGIAVLNPDGSVRLLSKLPDTNAGLLDLLAGVVDTNLLDDRPVKVSAAVEKVGGYVGRDVARGSHMFNFGEGVGAIKMALAARGCPDFVEIPPQQWQKGLGIPPRVKAGTRAETDAAWKNRLKAVAEKLFPDETITRATADALLIAEYHRRRHET